MIKTRKCKYCKAQFQPYTTLQKNCFEPDCVTAWIQETKDKNWKRKKAKLKLDLMTIQDYIKLAQQVFNKWINLRDKGLPCISCGKPINGRVNASHYFNANNHWSVRFNEFNVHSSCITCNQYLSGNLIEYRSRLINKIGIEQLTLLELEANKTRKFTIEELKQIINTYKLKIKQHEL
jgi:uncharacterized CHY-type Zn-finger protein